MIKRNLIVLLVVLHVHSMAQVVKHHILANTSFGCSSRKINADDNRNFSRTSKNLYLEVNLNAGYYLSGHFAVGYSGSIRKNNYRENFSTLQNSTSRKNINNDYASGAFARYNLPLKNGRLGLLFQLNGMYHWGNEHNYYIANSPYNNFYNESAHRNSGITAGITPGVLFFITPEFSMEASAGDIAYDYTVNQETQHATSKFGFNFSARAVLLGFSYYFTVNKKQ